jgi:hypothetical protein
MFFVNNINIRKSTYINFVIYIFQNLTYVTIYKT